MEIDRHQSSHWIMLTIRKPVVIVTINKGEVLTEVSNQNVTVIKCKVIESMKNTCKDCKSNKKK